MEELIEAVEALSQKTIFDYLVVIVPIFISIVAIYISISIANRQNKIALSEKRLEILSVVKLILCFSKSISCIQTNHLENRENIIVAYTSVFGIDISTNENAEFSANSVFRSVNKIERL